MSLFPSKKNSKSFGARNLCVATLAALGVVFLFSRAQAETEAPTERFFFAVGANDGGPQRARLRYAGRDASSMAAVMRELGGVRVENLILLEEPNRRSFRAAWNEVRGRLDRARERGARAEFFFYYSGHSDERGLIWGEERFGYDELRAHLRGLPSEVVVAILDSCASGSMTRRKGGTLRPAFLLDRSTEVRGHAFLTSSSANEVAQESDRIRGSFFTHHLLAGLRGAADTKGRGRVTLTEAYRYAFEETLAQTERTLGGPQHPAYEIDLVGSGDLVVTDLGRLSATLDLEPAIVGRVFVRDAAGDLVIEARKRLGMPLRLGLSPGAYVVTVIHGSNHYEGSVTLIDGQKSLLTQGDLRLVDAETASYRKGDWDRDGGYRNVPFEFSVFPSLSTDSGPRPTVTRFSLYLFAADGDRLDGSQIGLGVGWMREDVEGVQIAGIGNRAGAEVDGLQAAGVFNLAGGDVRGLQMALGLNSAGGEVDHLQMAVGLNLAYGPLDGMQMSLGPSLAFEQVHGIQFTGSLAYAGGLVDGIQTTGGVAYGGGRLEGVQVAGGASLVMRSAQGVQIGGGATFTGEDFTGFQAAGAFNWTGGSFEGAQVGGGLNYAGKVDGAQISALNLAGDVDGFQVGAVNIGNEVDGAQIGVVNVARSSDVPIGALNLIGDGRFRIGVWGSDLAIPQLALKTGSQTVHSILTAGIRPGTLDDPIWSLGAGFGLHLNLGLRGLHFLEPELMVTNVFRGSIDGEDHALVSSLRLGFGWDLARRFSIFAGPSLNVSVQAGSLRDEKVGIVPAIRIPADDRSVFLWPGFFGGFEI